MTLKLQHGGFDTSLVTLDSHAVKNQDFRSGWHSSHHSSSLLIYLLSGLQFNTLPCPADSIKLLTTFYIH